jgi:hypothetical protein
MKAAIPSGLSDSHQQALSKRLEFGNAHSLRRMVAQLVESVPGIHNHLIACPAAFADDVADLRNGLIHLSEDLSSQAEMLPSIEVLAEYLRIVLTFRFLADLGVPNDKLETALASSLRFTRHNLNEYVVPMRGHYSRDSRSQRAQRRGGTS